MARLEDPSRREFQDPAKAIEALGLQPGEALIDLGCGPGWFALPAAVVLGDRGVVYGVDAEPAMLERLSERAAAAGLGNVKPVHTDGKNLHLPDACADAALLANVLHELGDPLHTLGEVRRALRPGGRLLVIDWRKERADKGPPEEERLAEADARRLLEQAGFTPLRSAAAAAGPYHYGLLWRGETR